MARALFYSGYLILIGMFLAWIWFAAVMSLAEVLR